MSENSTKQRIIYSDGKLDKILIVDTLPIYSRGLAATLNAKECVILHSQYNTMQDIYSAVIDSDFDAVFVAYYGSHEQDVVLTIISALKQKRTPIFILSNEQNLQWLGPFVTRRCKTLQLNAFPERIIEEVMKSPSLKFPSVESFLSQNLICMPSRELTQAEKRVINEMLKGYSVKEIAQHFSKSVKTISAQKQNAIRRLGVRNTQELFLLLCSDKGKSLVR